MINIFVDKNLNQFVIFGHSGYEEAGKDIVCAGVSSLFYAAINSLKDLNNFNIVIDKNEPLSKIEAKDNISEHDLVVLEVLLNGFKSISETYKNYVKLKITGGK